MKKNRAFTLIELLVVIAIIAILLSVLIPALTKIKDAGKRAICLYDLHALGQAWVVYAEQNDAKLCNSKKARINEIPTTGGARQFRMNWAPTAYHNEPTWVGWWDGARTDAIAQQACLTLGTLFPIVDTIKVYRCPIGDRNEWRTFSIPDSLNGHNGFESYTPPGKVIRKMSELRSPGTRMSFIDEGLATTESWTINPPPIVKWWDAPPLRHGEGTTVAMADGSSEYWKWHNEKTFHFINDPSEANSVPDAIDNEDFAKIQTAVWGRTVAK
jgi:prepilin-type N-terminal cleavage/methylation domain-containing protein/prepilin-type processing-associated H-X9-DG protein